MKNKFKYSDMSFMIIHCITHLHQIYVSCLKQECRVKKGRAPDKSFRKTFEEKEGNIQTISEFSKPKSQLSWI